MQLNTQHLIRLPREDSKRNCLNGFWQWIAILASGDYERALEALFWPNGTTWTPEVLKARITTFFGGNDPWSVVIPNERLVGVVEEVCQYEAGRQGGGGWFMAQIPLTTAPSDPMDDQIPLMGLATSFFVREHQNSYVLEFEIFHV